MRPCDRLLLFLALDGAPRGLDPVRLQKGMFLFAKEGEAEAGEKYSFAPYNYGPMSKQIYADLDRLIALGLVKEVPVQGQSWSRYEATAKGLVRGRELLAADPSPRPAEQLHAIKKDVASKSFKALLEDVYERYPKYAEKSVFRRGD